VSDTEPYPSIIRSATQVYLVTTTILRPFVRDYLGKPVPEETLTHPPSWSSSNLYQLLPSTTIHSILRVQITCLAIFLHNLSPRPQVYLVNGCYATRWFADFRGKGWCFVCVGRLTTMSDSLSQLLEEMSRCHRDVAVFSAYVCVYRYRS